MNIDDILDQLQPQGALKPKDFNLAKEDVNKLKRAWINERMSPELLNFETALLDRIMERVRTQMEYIEENTLELQGSDIKVKLLIVESELERIKFLIRNYLRIRLTKIDKFTLYIQTDEDQLNKLSEKEVDYMNRHAAILHNLYKSQFLSTLPEQLQQLDDTSGGISMIEEPDLDRAVFIRVLNDVPEPISVGNDQVDLQKGNIYTLRYSSIIPYIKTGDVEIV